MKSLPALVVIFVLATALPAYAAFGPSQSPSPSPSAGSAAGTYFTDLECYDTGAISFRANPRPENITAAYVKNNETIPNAPGRWVLDTFTSNEAVFIWPGEYLVNGLKVNCPGFKFSCTLANIKINSCWKADGWKVQFTAKEISGEENLKYTFITSGKKELSYDKKSHSTELVNLSVEKTGPSEFLLTAPLLVDLSSAQITDNVCLGKSHSYGLANCTEVKEAAEGDGFKCSGLLTTKDRVRCRVNLDEEDEYNYLPEECRSAVARDECISTYKKFQTCFSPEKDSERVGCAKKALGVGDLPIERARCDVIGADNRPCLKKLKERIFSLIKFRIYNLEYKAQELKRIASDDIIIDLITDLENKKVEFNSTVTMQEKIDVLNQVKQRWAKFVYDVNGVSK